MGLTGGRGLTDHWLEQSAAVARRIGAEVDEDQLRLGVAVTRGLLIDVLATGDVATATRAMRRFVDLSA